MLKTNIHTFTPSRLFFLFYQTVDKPLKMTLLPSQNQRPFSPLFNYETLPKLPPPSPQPTVGTSARWILDRSFAQRFLFTPLLTFRMTEGGGWRNWERKHKFQDCLVEREYCGGGWRGDFAIGVLGVQGMEKCSIEWFGWVWMNAEKGFVQGVLVSWHIYHKLSV